MKILGSPFSDIQRGSPSHWKFTRTIHKKKYEAAETELGEDSSLKIAPDDARAESQESEARVAAAIASLELRFKEAQELTDNPDREFQIEGALKLISISDKLLSLLFSSDKPQIRPEQFDRLVRGYHYAANTFRTQQQFEISADFYLMSSRAGFAYAKYIGRGDYSANETVQKTIELAKRSYMRTKALLKETGADDRLSDILVESMNLRKRISYLNRSYSRFVLLNLWKLFSKYGTSIIRLIFCFVIYVILASVIQYLVFLNYFNCVIGLGIVWDTISNTIGGSRGWSPNVPLIDGTLRWCGFIWTALLGQAILQRVSIRI